MTLLLYLWQIPFTRPLIKPSYYWWRPFFTAYIYSVSLCYFWAGHVTSMGQWQWNKAEVAQYQCPGLKKSWTSAWAFLPLLSPQEGLAWLSSWDMKESERTMEQSQHADVSMGQLNCRCIKGARPKSAGLYRCMRNHWLFFYMPPVLRLFC